jgi:hypothetical protein
MSLRIWTERFGVDRTLYHRGRGCQDGVFGSGRDQQANERVFRACIHAQIVISSTVILDFAMAAVLFEP